MSSYSRIGYLMQNQKICFNNWNLLVNRGLKLSNSLPSNINHYNHMKLTLGQNKFKKLKNMLNLSRNLSTAVAACSPQRNTLQNKEKIKNYILFGSIITVCISVFLVNLSIPPNYDRVYIEIPKQINSDKNNK